MRLLISAAGSFDAQVGGGQVYVQKLAAELHRRGHGVVVIAVEPWAPRDDSHVWAVRWSQWRGISVAAVSIDPAAARPGERWSERSGPMMQALRSVVEQVSPSLMHLNGIKAALTTLAIERAIPHVITAHHGGVACPAGALLRPDDSICTRALERRACASCYCRQLQGGTALAKVLASLPPAVYRSAGTALNVLPNPTYAGRALMYPWLVEKSIDAKRSTILGAQRWIAPSQAIAQVLLRNGALSHRVSVIPHGIEPLRHSPFEGLGSRPVRFGYVGQINRPKGIHILIEAFAQLPFGLAQLEIVGNPQRAGEEIYLEKALRPAFGRTDVILRGAVPHEKIGQVMSSFDVLVLPAIYLEVFGLVILEAFSAGRPVIVTDSGGPSELVRDGVDGLIVPPNDAERLAGAMRLLAEHPEQIRTLASAIRPVRTLVQHVDDLDALYHAEVSAGTAIPRLANAASH